MAENWWEKCRRCSGHEFPNFKSSNLRRAKRWGDFTSLVWASQIQQHCKIYVNLFEIHNYLTGISISAHSLVNFWWISSSSLMQDGRITCTKAKETGHICSFEWTRRLKVPEFNWNEKEVKAVNTLVVHSKNYRIAHEWIEDSLNNVALRTLLIQYGIIIVLLWRWLSRSQIINSRNKTRKKKRRRK